MRTVTGSGQPRAPREVCRPQQYTIGSAMDRHDGGGWFGYSFQRAFGYNLCSCDAMRGRCQCHADVTDILSTSGALHRFPFVDVGCLFGEVCRIRSDPTRPSWSGEMRNIYGVVSSGPDESDSLGVKILTKVLAEVRVEVLELAGKLIHIAYNESETIVTTPTPFETKAVS